jgi:hypothetical protein
VSTYTETTAENVSETHAVHPAFVILTSGKCVSFGALMFLWELEDRGLSVCPEGDALTVSPSNKLTDSDRESIRQHRDALLAIVASECIQ